MPKRYGYKGRRRGFRSKKQKTSPFGSVPRPGLALASRHRIGQAAYARFSARPIIGFPDRVEIRLRTYFTVTLTSTTGALAAAAVGANSIYQPFAVPTIGWGSTHQCPTYTKLASIYASANVKAARITVKAFPAAANGQPCWMGLYGAADANAPATEAAFVESARTGKTLLMAQPGGASRQYVLSLYSTTSAMSGDPDATTDAYYGNWTTMTARPANAWYFWVGFQTADSASTANAYADVILDQWAVVTTKPQSL